MNFNFWVFPFISSIHLKYFLNLVTRFDILDFAFSDFEYLLIGLLFDSLYSSSEIVVLEDLVAMLINLFKHSRFQYFLFHSQFSLNPID